MSSLDDMATLVLRRTRFLKSRSFVNGKAAIASEHKSYAYHGPYSTPASAAAAVLDVLQPRKHSLSLSYKITSELEYLQYRRRARTTNWLYVKRMHVGRIQHERLARQEQRSNQRVCCTTDAVVQGTARSHVFQGSRI